jgi:hypothetical protein
MPVLGGAGVWGISLRRVREGTKYVLERALDTHMCAKIGAGFMDGTRNYCTLQVGGRGAVLAGEVSNRP